MEDEMNFTASVILLLLSSAMLLFPPARQDLLFGYRTPQAFKSPENWKLAQRISGILLFLTSVSMLSLSIYAQNSGFSYHAIGQGLMPGLVLTVFVTEIWLWRKGNKENRNRDI